MADEEQKNDEQVEETQDEAAAADDPATGDASAASGPLPESGSAEASPAPEPPADEAADAAPVEDEPEEEAPVEEPAAEEAAPAAAAPAGDGEPEEAPGPKEIRKLQRSRHKGPARPPRGPDERATERAGARRTKAADRHRYRTGHRQRRGEPGTGTSPAERVPGPKKVRLGKVVSTKADKTITVRIEIVRRHPTYEKVVRRTATLHAHDAANEAHEGDTVRVIETRPLSKTKRWRLMEIVEKAR